MVSTTVWPANADQAATVRRLADQFAGTVVDDGQAVGIGVGIVIGNRSYFYSYGDAVAATDTTRAVPFAPDTIFQIGSTTKVFTTNLLGQQVHNHTLRLADPLTSLSAETGLLTGMHAVTLEELGDFTAGLPQYAPLCTSSNNPPGCLPNDRPSLQQYSAADFLTFFAGFTPQKLPAPYLYSDFSTGLLRLLLSGSAALDNRAVDMWFEAVRQRLLEPLGMRSTFLYVPAEVRGRTASGYQLALAAPRITNGMVSDYSMTSGGALYTAVPAVQVSGGPGGATATANLEDGHVSSLTPRQTGMNYRSPTVTGGIGGFSSEARLMPARDMAVVVFANARSVEVENGNPTQTAERIADNLLYGLLYTVNR
jgi:CubicO group peptidase (beta-lactamase class C family)